MVAVFDKFKVVLEFCSHLQMHHTLNNALCSLSLRWLCSMRVVLQSRHVSALFTGLLADLRTTLRLLSSVSSGYSSSTRRTIWNTE